MFPYVPIFRDFDMKPASFKPFSISDTLKTLDFNKNNQANENRDVVNKSDPSRKTNK